MGRDGTRVLVGLDGGETAETVLAVARRYVTAVGAWLEPVHVGTQLPPRLGALTASTDVDVVLEAGEPVDVLRERLGDPAVQAAVVGCRAPGGPRPAGHVALGLVEGATAPVLVVPPGTTVGQAPLQDVLLPLDGSHETTAAVEPTVRHLAASGLRITVAHVFDPDEPPSFLDQQHHALDAWGQEFLARHATPGSDIVLRAGQPGEALLDVVEATTPDLVVLGWSQDLSAGHAATVRELLTASPAPLLLVPVEPVDAVDAGDRPDEGAVATVRGRPDS